MVSPRVYTSGGHLGDSSTVWPEREVVHHSPANRTGMRFEHLRQLLRAGRGPIAVVRDLKENRLDRGSRRIIHPYGLDTLVAGMGSLYRQLPSPNKVALCWRASFRPLAFRNTV